MTMYRMFTMRGHYLGQSDTLSRARQLLKKDKIKRYIIICYKREECHTCNNHDYFSQKVYTDTGLWSSGGGYPLREEKENILDNLIEYEDEDYGY